VESVLINEWLREGLADERKRTAPGTFRVWNAFLSSTAWSVAGFEHIHPGLSALALRNAGNNFGKTFSLRAPPRAICSGWSVDTRWNSRIRADQGILTMKSGYLALLGWGLLAGSVQAQDATFVPEATQNLGYGGAYNGPGSVGSSEPLFRYDDQERWKHGWVRNVPYYEGFHSFRPYNYHHVFSQAQTAAGWGMPATMPYSQQFWHRYEGMTDLSRGDHSPVAPYVPPPSEFDHYPRSIRNEGSNIVPGPAAAIPLPPGPAASAAPVSRAPTFSPVGNVSIQGTAPQMAPIPGQPLQVP